MFGASSWWKVPSETTTRKPGSLRVPSSGCCSLSDNSEGIQACLGLGYGQNKGVKIYFSPRELITTSPQTHGFVVGIHTICVGQNSPIQKFGFNWFWIGNALRHLANTLKKRHFWPRPYRIPTGKALRTMRSQSTFNMNQLAETK